MRAALVMGCLVGCGDKAGDSAAAEAEGCAAFPESPSAPDGVLESEDSCGWWELPVGEHLYVNVGLSEPKAECSESLGAGLALNASPTYSNFEPDGPKWTFDVVAEASATASAVEITCSDGSAWSALVDVL